MINTFVEKSKLLPPVKTRVVRPFLSPLRIHSAVSEVGLKKIIESVAASFALIVAAAG